MNKPFRSFGAPARIEGPRDLDQEQIMNLIHAVDDSIAETNQRLNDPVTLAQTAKDALSRLDSITVEAVDAEFARLDAVREEVREEWSRLKPAFQQRAARIMERVQTYTSDEAALLDYLAKRAATLKIPD